TKLETIRHDMGWKSTGGPAFRRSGINAISIPSTVSVLPHFYHCDKLTDIIIPEGVSKISQYNFNECKNIKRIYIPASVSEIDTTFPETEIEEITVSKDNPYYHCAGNCLIRTDTKELIAGFGNSLIPDDDSVTIIGPGAFYGREKLSSIKLPESIKLIKENAFKKCSNLKKVFVSKFPLNVSSTDYRFPFDIDRFNNHEIELVKYDK
ncbi:MAG: leucine-rich repeat domain-containing protein, partial [Clostridia bacterium]|nr:leucine-rich repeat domain-containing protein [Clostridia bacterium]